MLKDLFDKGKCALGFHSGDWRYLRQDSCQQVRVCTRCNTESRQVVHTWQPWEYQSPQTCQMIRPCSRCAETEAKTEHAWSAPVYESDGSCALVRPCSRCGENLAAGTAHVWELWSYDSAGSCSQTIRCSRCSAPGTQTRIAHEWGNWCHSDFYSAPVCVCRRCAEMIFDGQNKLQTQNQASLQAVHCAVSEIIQSKDTAGVHGRLSQHQEVLFDPVAEKYFRFAIDQLAADESDRDTLRRLSQLIARCREQGIDVVFRPGAKSASQATTSTASGTAPAQVVSAPARDKDTRLVGHWRHTEAFASGGFSMATDTHCVLNADGRFEWRSTSSGFGTRHSVPECGQWSAIDNVLRLEFDNGTQLEREYVLQGTTMFWPGEGRYRLWERI